MILRIVGAWPCARPGLPTLGSVRPNPQASAMARILHILDVKTCQFMGEVIENGYCSGNEI
jgi:hypothetical protein